MYTQVCVRAVYIRVRACDLLAMSTRLFGKYENIASLGTAHVSCPGNKMNGRSTLSSGTTLHNGKQLTYFYFEDAVSLFEFL